MSSPGSGCTLPSKWRSHLGAGGKSAGAFFPTSQLNQKQNMNSIVKRIVMLLFLTTLVALVGLGCNTAQGFGKDVEKAGEKIQDGTQ